MRTLQGRLEDLINTGITNCDGFTPEECISLAKEASAKIGKEFVFDGKENIIKEK